MSDRDVRPPYGRRRFLAGLALAGLGTAVGLGVDDLTTTSVHAKKQSHRASHPRKPIFHGRVSGSFHSVRRGVEVGWIVSFPRGWRPDVRIPLCLVLHAYGTDHTYALDTLRIQLPHAAHNAKTPFPMVLAAADGGSTYWHPRANGDDPQAMLMDEFLPMLETMNIFTGHLVAYGVSMGGYGSLLLAETYPTRIRRVGAESPAIWPSYAASQNANPTAFDSAADWSTHDVVGHLADLGQMPVLIECGDTDPFSPASRQMVTLLKPGEVVMSPGGHDNTFWKPNALSQVKFLATQGPK